MKYIKHATECFNTYQVVKKELKIGRLEGFLDELFAAWSCFKTSWSVDDFQGEISELLFKLLILKWSKKCRSTNILEVF